MEYIYEMKALYIYFIFSQTLFFTTNQTHSLLSLINIIKKVYDQAKQQHTPMKKIWN